MGRREEVQAESDRSAEALNLWFLRERSLQAWVEDISKSLWHKTGRWKPGKSRAWNIRIPTPKDVGHGEEMGSASPRLITVSCIRKLSRDVTLDVELALVSSVETIFFAPAIIHLASAQNLTF